MTKRARQVYFKKDNFQLEIVHRLSAPVSGQIAINVFNNILTAMKD